MSLKQKSDRLELDRLKKELEKKKEYLASGLNSDWNIAIDLENKIKQLEYEINNVQL